MELEYLLGFSVILFIVIAEILRRREILNPVDARKVLHIGAISAAAFAALSFNNIHTLFLIVTLALPVLFGAVWFGFFKNPENGRRSFGILYFALAYWILLYFFGETRPRMVFSAMFVLAWSDGLATVVGNRFAELRWPFSPDKKSPLGSAVFFFSTLVILLALHGEMEIGVSLVLFLALFLTALEALSMKGLDNLWVPGALAYWLLLNPEFGTFQSAMVAVIPALAYLAYRKRWLASGGAFAATLLGWIMLINPEPKWILPALAFFLIGSVLSKIRGSDTEKKGRNANQVFSNGGAPVLFLMAYFLTDSVAMLVALFAGFAFAMSDTASSEIGVRFGKRHFDIRTMKMVQAGLSGAVSARGSLAGVLFAMAIAALGYFMLDSPVYAIVILIAGILGNLTDTLVGAYLQAKEVAPDGSLRDRRRGKIVSGLNWITNDITNLISSIIATLLGFLGAHLF